ncbi:unnamed protein product [Diplocarpon coronariae]
MCSLDGSWFHGHRPTMQLVFQPGSEEVCYSDNKQGQFPASEQITWFDVSDIPTDTRSVETAGASLKASRVFAMPNLRHQPQRHFSRQRARLSRHSPRELQSQLQKQPYLTVRRSDTPSTRLGFSLLRRRKTKGMVTPAGVSTSAETFQHGTPTPTPTPTSSTRSKTPPKATQPDILTRSRAEPSRAESFRPGFPRAGDARHLSQPRAPADKKQSPAVAVSRPHRTQGAAAFSADSPLLLPRERSISSRKAREKKHANGFESESQSTSRSRSKDTDFTPRPVEQHVTPASRELPDFLPVTFRPNTC